MTDSEFKIEKNVPMPRLVAEYQRHHYPWPEMEVGDSTVVSFRARQAAYKWGKYHGRRFTARRQPDGAYRVWRVA